MEQPRCNDGRTFLSIRAINSTRYVVNKNSMLLTIDDGGGKAHRHQVLQQLYAWFGCIRSRIIVKLSINNHVGLAHKKHSINEILRV